MTPKIYNTLTKKKEAIATGDKQIKVYTCGPTVYDQAHVGNLRSFVLADLLVRTLRFSGLEVKQVMNLTDIDDKTITGSQKAKLSLSDFTAPFIDLFMTDIERMNIEKPNHITKATEYIPQMIKFIEILIKKDFAYITSDGVYFDIAKSSNYGQLAELDMRGTNTQTRINNDEYDKANPGDFVLWKKQVASDGENAWPSPWGPGRPGWHLECSVMATEILGPQIDIHTGGQDLIFPHHTNEIAQSEAATDQKPFVKNWFHVGFLKLENQKISKSLGHNITLNTLFDKGFSPLDYRYWLLGAHYHGPMNFTWQALSGAKEAYNRLKTRLAEMPAPTTANEEYVEKFSQLIKDDLAIPQALALGWKLLSDKNISPESQVATWLVFDQVFGLNLNQALKEKSDFNLTDLPEAIRVLIEKRNIAREEKNWSEADRLREDLKLAGYDIIDESEGVKIKKIS